MQPIDPINVIVKEYRPIIMTGDYGTSSTPTASASAQSDQKQTASEEEQKRLSGMLIGFPTEHGVRVDPNKYHYTTRRVASEALAVEDVTSAEFLSFEKVQAWSLDVKPDDELHRNLCATKSDPSVEGMKLLKIEGWALALAQHDKDSAFGYAMEFFCTMKKPWIEESDIINSKGKFFLLSIEYIFKFLCDPKNTPAARLVKAKLLPHSELKAKVMKILASKEIDDAEKILCLRILYGNAFGNEAETKAAREALDKSSKMPKAKPLPLIAEVAAVAAPVLSPTESNQKEAASDTYPKHEKMPFLPYLPREGSQYDPHEFHCALKGASSNPFPVPDEDVTSAKFLSFAKVPSWDLNVDPSDETGRIMCAGMCHLDARGQAIARYGKDSAVTYATEWLYEMKIDGKEKVEIIHNKGRFFLLSIEYIFQFLCDPRNTLEERLVKAKLLPHFALKEKVISILISKLIDDSQKIACLRILYGNAFGKEEEVKAAKAKPPSPKANAAAAAAAAAATATPTRPPTTKPSPSMRRGHRRKKR